jgi:hypothetical protein
VDDEHGLVAGFSFVNGLGLDISSGRLFISTPYNIGGAPSPSGEGAKSGVYVLGPAGGVPTASLDSISDVTASSATIHATVSPNGGPPVSYRLEYSLDGTNWKSTPETLVGVQETPVPITAVLDPPPFGLDPVALYHVRVKVTKAFTPSLTTSELTFTTSTVPPAVETTGSPIRTTESAKLGGRVTPRGSATTYFFEYGDQGPCGSNPCTQTPAQPAGTGQFVQLVAEEVTELQPGTTYHYRVVADNGQPGSPVFGEDMTVTTRSGEAPLSHGHFPGPPGSDRAWEQVSAPNAGGNSVTGTNVISDNGTRAVWELNGGSPSSETGGFNQFYSERTSHGWLSKSIYPPRNQLAGPNWHPPMGPSDLSLFTALNFEIGGRFALFRMTPGLPPKKLHEVGSEAEWGSFELMSDDGSRVLMATTTSADPAHPVSPGAAHLYDVTSGDPHLVDLLPGETIPTCGLQIGGHGSSSPYFMSSPSRGDHWISADGNLAYFMGRSGATCGRTQIYVRDFSAAETKQLSGAAVSGEACSAGFIQSNPKSVLFWTKARLVVEDSEPADCTTSDAHGDVYRYDLSSESLDCVTCAVEGVDANVFVGGAEPGANIAVAPDGSRVYFRTSQILLPGARTPGIYRADVESGDLAYVGSIGEVLLGLNEMSADGSLLFFSSSDSSLNALGGGSGNAGTAQLYRYDDDDRSLICVSCPQDGSAPRGAASRAGGGGGSPNVTQLSENGIFAFSTPTPLTGADQNTAAPGQDPQRGTDAYEWRDGRLLLLSDGLTDWPGGEGAPAIKGMTPSGSDILFTAAAQYTPDALDNFRRLYTARIAGGIEFPKPPPPCPLEVCQGTPKGAPEEAAPGTGVFAGPGNLSQRKPGRCAAGKRKVRRGGKTRCVSKKRPARKANHNRRVAR